MSAGDGSSQGALESAITTIVGESQPFDQDRVSKNDKKNEHPEESPRL